MSCAKTRLRAWPTVLVAIVAPSTPPTLFPLILWRKTTLVVLMRAANLPPSAPWDVYSTPTFFSLFSFFLPRSYLLSSIRHLAALRATSREKATTSFASIVWTLDHHKSVTAQHTLQHFDALKQKSKLAPKARRARDLINPKAGKEKKK